LRYCVPEEVLDRAIGDELLVHRFDTDEVFVLNGDAKLVFEAAKGGATREGVREFVAGHIFGDTLDLYHAVDQALDEMVAQGLLSELPPDPALPGSSP
jgi:hypothetical protein